LEVDLGGEDVEGGEDLLELGAGEGAALFVESEADCAECDTTLLLDLHSELVDDAVRLNVESYSE